MSAKARSVLVGSSNVPSSISAQSRTLRALASASLSPARSAWAMARLHHVMARS